LEAAPKRAAGTGPRSVKLSGQSLRWGGRHANRQVLHSHL